MAFDKIVGVDGTTYQFPSVVRQRIADNIETVGSVENLAVIDALAPALATKSNTTHNHTLASLSSNNIDELGDVEIGVVGPNGIALADKHTLQYEASTSRWRNKVASGGVTVGDTRPATPIPGDAWFDSNDGTLYVYYSDVNTAQWVQVQANSALEGTILARLGAVESRTTALEAVPNYNPNPIINGAFDIWQRGTSFSASGYTADRWTGDFVTGAGSVTRETFTPGTAPVAGYEGQFFLRRNVTTGAQFSSLIHRIEDVRTFAGQTVTLSFWAKGVNPTGNFLVGMIQNFGSGGSGDISVGAGTLTLTNSWVRYTYTFSLPSVAGKTIGANSYVWLSIYQAAANTSVSTLDIWGVQLEDGPIATPFHRNANSIQGELAACQRYFYGIQATNNYSFYGQGYGYTGTNAEAFVQFPVPMRVAPTSISFSNASHFVASDGTTTRILTGLALFPDDRGTNAAGLNVTVASGISTLRYYTLLAANTTSAFLGFNAEL